MEYVLNRELFRDRFQELCILFNVTKPVEKAKIYFPVLEKYNDRALEKACNEIKLNHDRLPNISRFLEVIRAFQSFDRGKQDCTVCDGHGWIKVGLQVYRADCEHSEDLPKYVQKYTGSEEIEMFNQRSRYDAVYGEGYFDKILDNVRHTK